MNKLQAEELQEVVNTILKLAFDQRRQTDFLDHTAINWGDLSCTDVEIRTSLLSESELLTVIIEEAAPDAVPLHKFVSEKLESYGYKGVYVVTEW